MRSALVAALAAIATATAGIAFAQTPAERAAALPVPDAPFKGKIGKTFEDSTPDFPQGVKAPPGAPNVVLILLDDVGFGQPGTFGGPIPTPNIDKLAAQGLRYNRFHTAGVCSPSRAALLTGRNQSYRTGLAATPPELLDLSRSYRASALKTFVKVSFPMAYPSFSAASRWP
ncbi:MAG: sulfatase-like hydrolase/transferase [Chromatiales bacterium]